MKRFSVTFLVSFLGLGISRIAVALEPPGTDDALQAGWIASVAKISGLKVRNGISQGNPIGTWYWFYARHTTLPAPNLSTGSPDFDFCPGGCGGDRLISSDHLTSATDQPIVLPQSGNVNNLHASYLYNIYAQACDQRHYNDTNCSNWVQLRSTPQQMLDLPTDVFNDPVAADVTTNSIRIRTNPNVPDTTDVVDARINMRNLLTGVPTLLYPVAYTQSGPNAGTSLVSRRGGDDGRYPFLPNTRYQFTGELEYPYTQFTNPETKGAFWTTPRDPRTGSVFAENVTHCSAVIHAQNSDDPPPANPTYTMYRLCATGTGGNCGQDQQISGGAPTSSVTNTITGLQPQTNYTPSAQALVGNGDGTQVGWNNSAVLGGTVFQTQNWGGSFSVSNVTTTGATFNVSGIIGAGSITSWKIVLDGSSTGQPSGMGAPPAAILIPGLAPNTLHGVQIELTETSGCSSTLPAEPIQFNTQPVDPLPPSPPPLTATPSSITGFWNDNTNPTGMEYSLKTCTIDDITTLDNPRPDCKDASPNPTRTQPLRQSGQVTGLVFSRQYYVFAKALNASRALLAPALAPNSNWLRIGGIVTLPNGLSIAIDPPDVTVNGATIHLSVGDPTGLGQYIIEVQDPAEVPTPTWRTVRGPTPWPAGQTSIAPPITIGAPFTSPYANKHYRARASVTTTGPDLQTPRAGLDFYTKAATPITADHTPDIDTIRFDQVTVWWKDTGNPIGTTYRVHYCVVGGVCTDRPVPGAGRVDNNDQAFVVDRLTPLTQYNNFQIIALNFQQPTWPNSDPHNLTTPQPITTQPADSLTVTGSFNNGGYPLDNSEVCVDPMATFTAVFSRAIDPTTLDAGIRVFGQAHIYGGTPSVLTGWTRTPYDPATRSVTLNPPRSGGWPAAPTRLIFGPQIKDTFAIALTPYTKNFVPAANNARDAQTITPFGEPALHSVSIPQDTLTNSCVVLRSRFDAPTNALAADFNRADPTEALRIVSRPMEMVHIGPSRTSLITTAFAKQVRVRIPLAGTSATLGVAEGPARVPAALTLARLNPATNKLEAVSGASSDGTFVTGLVSQPGVYLVAQNLSSTDVSQAYAYPVPYKSNMGLPGVYFKCLGAQSAIRIYTMAGRKVREMSVPLGLGTCDNNQATHFLWDLKNSDGDNVASGVYFYVIESPGGKKDGKLIIVQ